MKTIEENSKIRTALVLKSKLEGRQTVAWDNFPLINDKAIIKFREKRKEKDMEKRDKMLLQLMKSL